MPQAEITMHDISAYTEILERFLSLMKESAPVSAVRVAPDKWTLAEMVGHLIDSASNNHQRFIRLQTGKSLQFPGYEAQSWSDVSKAGSYPFTALIELWIGYNRYLLHIIAHADAGAMNNVWETNQKKITLGELIEDYFRHILIHEKLYRERIDEIAAAGNGK